MKKTLLLLSVLVLLSGVSMAAVHNIAVVDLPAIIAKSTQVQTLKKEQKTKMVELDKWLKTAREDVAKQQTKENKEKLLKQYNEEFAKKKEVIAKDYRAKLSAVDKNITEAIISKAKSLGYDMVVSKSMVIMGGDDITAEVQKVVK